MMRFITRSSQQKNPLQEHNVAPAYRPDIDGLRAIAIISVVIFHAFPEILPGGFVGVDVFFVISGFLISSIIFRSLQRGDFSFAEFYAHRTKRIFPALIAALIFCMATGWFVLLPAEYQQLGKHITSGAGFAQNFTLWKEAGYFDTASELKPLMHLWSLAIEEQFYLIYPALIWCAWKIKARTDILLAILFIGSFALNIAGIENHATRTFFVPQTRFWELFAGSILAYIHTIQTSNLSHRNNKTNKTPLSIIGLVLIAASTLAINKKLLFPGWWALGPTLGAFLLIHAGPDAWGNRKILACRPMVFVGLISYPLYIWHWPLLSFARIIEAGIPDTTIRVAIVFSSIALAWATYIFIEKPIRFGKKTWLKTASLCTILAALAVTGFCINKNKGVPWRFDQSIQKLTAVIDFKWHAYIRNGTCHLQDPNLSMHSTICIESKHPSIALWGDSHASSLYPGLKKFQEHTDIGLTQLTTAGCPPIDNFNKNNPATRKNCEEINTNVLNNLKATPQIY